MPKWLPKKQYAKKMEAQEAFKTLAKSEGRWFGLNGLSTSKTSATVKGHWMLLPIPPAIDKLLIYGVDIALGISISTTTPNYSSGMYRGCVVFARLRSGQTTGDFSASSNSMPSSTAWDNLARPYAYYPILVSSYPGTTRNQVVLPFRLPGKHARLQGAEHFALGLLMDGSTPDGVDLRMDLTGRYRYVQQT